MSLVWFPSHLQGSMQSHYLGSDIIYMCCTYLSCIAPKIRAICVCNRLGIDGQSKLSATWFITQPAGLLSKEATLKGCIESSHISNLSESSVMDPPGLENCTRGQSCPKTSTT